VLLDAPPFDADVVGRVDRMLRASVRYRLAPLASLNSFENEVFFEIRIRVRA
jgi:hypothetical protein